MPNRLTNALWRAVRAVAGVFRPKMLGPASLSPVYGLGGSHWFTAFDTSAGAWQRDETPANMDHALANWAVYACLTLISSDVGKMRLKLVELGDDGIWREVRSAAFSPVLRKPNSYQTRQRFVESWILSKLGPAGNTYVLKVRDNRGIVTAMHVLDPWRATPLIAPDGSVWYRLGQDYLASVQESDVIVPASEIIHDRAACLFHPLIGVSPLYASALPAQQGLSIQTNADKFFQNRSMPGGVLTSPGAIGDKTLERLKTEWSNRFSGDNAGKTAILGDGLKYEPFGVNARESQLTEQLGQTAKAICTTYHVPPFKIGLETLPAGQKVGDMNQIYYADCLQTLIESIEALLDEGLGLEMSGKRYGTEFEVDDLLRMDTTSLVTSLGEAVGRAIMKPDEARFRLNLPPVPGGDTPYLQEQNFSLEALAKRDAQDDPFASKTAAPASPQPSENDDDDETVAVEAELRAQGVNLPSLVRPLKVAA